MRARSGGLAAVVVVLTSCGGGGKPKGALPPTARPAAVDSSPLARHDQPPAGVDRIYQGFLTGHFGLGGCMRSKITCAPNGAGCTQERLFEVQTPLSDVRPMSVVQVCTDGFGAELSISITSPSGKTRDYRRGAGDDEDGSWVTLLPPGPPGVYTVRASSGGGQPAEKQITVIAATGPSIMQWPQSGRPGTAFQTALTGFPPGRSVDLHLYRGRPDNSLEYATTLRVDIDGEGQGELTIASRAGDPAAIYALIAGGADASINFDLEAPDQ